MVLTLAVTFDIFLIKVRFAHCQIVLVQGSRIQSLHNQVEYANHYSQVLIFRIPNTA